MAPILREGAKNMAHTGGLALALPALLSYRCKSLVLGPNRALEGSSQALSLIPGLLGRYIRQAFFSRVLAGCERTVVIEFGTIFSQTGARLDERAYIGPHCHLGLVHIESYAMLAAGVHVPSGAHTHRHAVVGEPIQLQPQDRRLVRIGAGSWIGSGAVIMADVGSNSIIGAGSVVTKPIPDGVVAAGVPARVLRERETSGT